MSRKKLIELAEEGIVTAREADDQWTRDELDELSRAVLEHFKEEATLETECQSCKWPKHVGHYADCPYRTDFS